MRFDPTTLSSLEVGNSSVESFEASRETSGASVVVVRSWVAADETKQATKKVAISGRAELVIVLDGCQFSV